ncbi:UNVERIFIED_CONTAM: hypothetical protein Sangu_1166400 [Sesamum angustifolium]|uniref:BRCT domain-containing protein n=1 Tax=Sesamum angustifolium TaxID=2727405 RepID=A0AAW2P3W0_9LAMI
MATKVFKGANVFMSRNLVPPELFDALHDALKLNGAQVLLCCDPSRNGPNDYHVIASHDHEKFEDLRAKGCPQCVLSCAKEHRVLPNQGFTCCLAMDGVNILASGFEKDEKAEIAKMVTAMGGVLVTKASSDVSFVIVKNVLAQKYKWALNNLKKPIVTTSWLLQCWKEHRVVPQDCYRVLPFSGLTICVSGIPADERKEMEKLVVQNGGKYSAQLTKRSPEGDKYKVAKRWGHIYIVTRKWFHQSVARRACLSEESYPVQGSTMSSLSTLKTAEQHSQGKGIRNSQHTSSSMATASDSETNFSAQDMGPDLENTLPNIYPAFFEALSLPKEDNDRPADTQKSDPNFARCVADDSQSEDDDLYLSECRILLVGFEAFELRKLVDMVRRGGGSRYMSFSEKLTHVIVGKPSELEIKEVRSIAAFGVIYVVKTAWLEECTFKKKEVPVLKNHIAYDLLLPKGFKEEAKPKVQSGVSNGKHMKSSTVFKGKLFRFSSSFPEEQDGCLLDVSSHILYSPLTCQIPLPGFEGYRLCVSRYDMRERQLLRNLCYVLGVKFVEKLTKKVTHLLCKFADGDKYEAACRWGIHVVTADWIYECATKIQDRKSQETSGCHENFLSSNSTMLGQRHADGQSDPGPSKHWMNRLEKRDDNSSADAAARGFYDGFSETQTDSQVVGYEEDLSGRQMIIDRVRTRSSMA